VNPTAFTARIESGHAVQLLRRVEAHHDIEGWHSHANMHVYVVYDHHDVVTANAIEQAMRCMGKPIRNSRYSAQPMMPFRMFARAGRDHGLTAPEALHRFAFNTVFADTELIRLNQNGDHDDVPVEQLEAFRDLISMPGILGYIACSEAHVLHTDQAKKAHQHHIPFAYMPGAVEIRGTWMVDVTDRVHSVQRNRGETAELVEDCRFFGTIVNALRMLMDFSAGRSPEDQAGYDARYPDTAPD
jgi:hypothetical protein